MTGSHPGGPGEAQPDIVASGSWRGHRHRPAGLAPSRRRVAAIATVAVMLIAGWAGRDYVTGSWRYFIEHRSPLTPGLLCPTRPGRAGPGPGLLAAVADLGRGVPPGILARQYGCEPASGVVDTQTTPGPLPSAALKRILTGRAADTYVMASIEKLGTVCGYKISGLADVAGIITDAPADDPTVCQLRDEGVTIVQAA